MSVLISGIGRSGTTTMFHIVGKGFIKKYKEEARCVYEPYLWNLPQIAQTAEVKGQPFSVEQIGLFNVNVHCNTPIFLKGRNGLHDHWLRNALGPVLPSSSLANEKTLVKVIRGAGRLEAALTKYTNLKVIIVTRNPVDTLNSGLGLLSFFGDEFHPSDKKRFLEEVNENFDTTYTKDILESEFDYARIWWRYLTEASFSTARKYPERVKVVPYEVYVENKLKYMAEIFDFIGLEKCNLDRELLDEGAGPITKDSFINVDNVFHLQNNFNWYYEELLNLGFEQLNQKRKFSDFDKLISKYSLRNFITSPLNLFSTTLTAIQWRGKYARLVNQPNKCLNIKPFSVSAAQAIVGRNHSINCKNEKSYFKKKNKESIGVLITSYNNEDTIAECIYSVLNQTLKADLIVIADDCSSDATFTIIKDIAKSNSNITIARRSENVGVAANRDLAIRSMDVDYITTLDGDDLYYSEKLELEFFAIQHSDAEVAFSDIVVCSDKGMFSQNTLPYSNITLDVALKFLTSRTHPVPRDMMFSKELFVQADGFDVGMSLYEDWSFKMRLLAVSGEKGWVHSGGKGSIYDRRNPGLSNKKPIEHAYGQLVALTRNADLFKSNSMALEGGLKTVANQLEGNMQSRFNACIKRYKSESCSDLSIKKLNVFWENVSYKDNIEYKYQHIWQFTIN